VRIGVLLLLTGCDVLWSIDHVARHDAAPPDEPPDGPPACGRTDDFAGVDISPLWNQFMNNAYVIKQDEVLQLDLGGAPMTNGEVGVRFLRAFDMHGASVEVEVPQVVTDDNNVENYMRLRARNDNSRNYTIRYGNGKIDFRIEGTGAMPFPVLTYSAQNHRFWKISNEPGTDMVSFWTRGTSDGWFLQTTKPATVSLDAMEIMFVAGTYNGGTAVPGAATYDNFAVCGAQELPP
jgi:hypothetical protein